MVRVPGGQIMNNFTQFLKWEETSRDTIDFKKVYCDVAEDLIGGLVLSELIYWYLPSKGTDKNKLRVTHEGLQWIAIRYKDWWGRLRITESQAERAIKILVDKKVIEKRVFKFNGEPTVHIRILENEFLEQLEKAQSLFEQISISATTENQTGYNRHPLTKSTALITSENTLATALFAVAKPEPIRVPCDIDGIPDDWKDKPSKKLIIKENETRLASTISGLLGIKQPICNNKKDYAALSVTWWKPIKEMLRQTDGDVEKAERIVDDVIIAYRAANLTINSPKSLINGFIGELVKNNKRKIIGKTQDGEVIYE